METVWFTAGREAGCPARSVQADSRGCCQRGWVWCCRAPWYEVKLQAVSGQVNTQLCPTRWAQGEKIQEAFPRDMGVPAWTCGCQPAPRAPPATQERTCKGRRPNWQGLAGSRSHGGWGGGDTAGQLLRYSPPTGTLQRAGEQRGEREEQNKLCALVGARPRSSVSPK